MICFIIKRDENFIFKMWTVLSVIPTFPLQFSHPTRTKYTCPKLLKTDRLLPGLNFTTNTQQKPVCPPPVWGAELSPRRSAGPVSSASGLQGSPHCCTQASGCRTALGCVGHRWFRSHVAQARLVSPGWLASWLWLWPSGPMAHDILWARDWASVPCIMKWILSHWTTKETPTVNTNLICELTFFQIVTGFCH